ncbi:MAG: DUF2236 domain-containing protein [bacterium]|nr:DUF2236 domain-containing protein [bacterium]
MAIDKWKDDEFLDQIRKGGDDLADEAVTRLHSEHGIEAVNRIFQNLRGDHQPLPDDAPAPFVDFMEATAEVPGGLDVERLERGVEVLRTHAIPAAVVLLASSLPSGYSAPCLSRVLTVSNNLGTHPYRRLMGVLQMVVNVSSMPPTDGDGRAHLTARKLRLLHSGIRLIVPRYRPEYREKYGVPCNHEDMLGTIMGFSLLVINGLKRLEIGLTDEQAEDFYYVWRIFIQMMGIHPTGEPMNAEYVPESVAEASAFYESYSRRHYVTAAENPDGVFLSRVNLAMMRSLIPGKLRRACFGGIPRLAMEEILGVEGMRRVGIEPARNHALQRRIFFTLLRWLQRLEGSLGEHFIGQAGALLFQKLINVSRGGEVEFIVPEDLEMVQQQL